MPDGAVGRSLGLVDRPVAQLLGGRLLPVQALNPIKYGLGRDVIVRQSGHDEGLFRGVLFLNKGQQG